MNLKMMLYCTKAKGKHDYLRKLPSGRYCLSRDKGNSLNGKIACVSDYEVEEIKEIYCCGCIIQTKTMCHEELLGRSCLTDEEFNEYMPNYAIHIKNLYKFITPKELKDLYIKGTYNNAEQMFTDEIQINGEWFHPMERAPQNMCYAVDEQGNRYVVISVHPEWLCLILNGLKDVEVRRKVLKEML